MTIEDLMGKYVIEGSNQDSNPAIMYRGILTLSLNPNNRIDAHWLISDTQIQTGEGFFKDGILVVNFKYEVENNVFYKGVVVYRCLTNDILEGFWSEKHGDPLYLGSERALKIQANQLLN